MHETKSQQFFSEITNNSSTQHQESAGSYKKRVNRNNALWYDKISTNMFIIYTQGHCRQKKKVSENEKGSLNVTNKSKLRFLKP